LNWHVVEIEGEATLIEETEIKDIGFESVSIATPAQSRGVMPPQIGSIAPAIHEQYDDVVVAGMQVRRVVAIPGEKATFEVTIANHGRWAALFEVALEGWIDEAWTPDLPLRVQLEAGARQSVTLTVDLPRQSTCRAGDHALAVVVRSARYPGHITRIAAMLVIERYASLKLGTPQPPAVDLSWFVHTAMMRLPVTNQSNYPATVHLQGMDRQRQCDFTFYTDGSALDDAVMGTAHVTLQPGQTVAVPVEIRMRQRPLIGITPRMTPFRLVARVDTEPPLRRAVDGQLAVGPLIGPWQMAIAGVLGVIAIFATGLAGLALLVALRTTSPANAALPVATAVPAPAAPVVAFIIQMDQPMPTRAANAPSSSGTVQLLPQNPANVTPQVPVVSADQVTAPGQPTPVGQKPLRPSVVTTPPAQAGAPPASSAAPQAANKGNMTYGQMFKDVASRYDLDWRVLAAQAYLESGFDSMALSDQGYLGLMQIHPNTWGEWAPKVNASDPYDAYSNVLVGAVYLNYLRTQLSTRGLPQQQWMLVAYNWGPEKLLAHLQAGGTWDTLDASVRQYAEDVLRIAATIPQ